MFKNFSITPGLRLVGVSAGMMASSLVLAGVFCLWRIVSATLCV